MDKNFDRWKNTIGRAASTGKMIGLSNKNIVGIGERLGTFLQKYVDPENEKERLLQELFEVGSKEEKRVLTRLLIKLSRRDKH